MPPRVAAAPVWRTTARRISRPVSQPGPPPWAAIPPRDAPDGNSGTGWPAGPPVRDAADATDPWHPAGTTGPNRGWRGGTGRVDRARRRGGWQRRRPPTPRRIHRSLCPREAPIRQTAADRTMAGGGARRRSRVAPPVVGPAQAGQ